MSDDLDERSPALDWVQGVDEIQRRLEARRLAREAEEAERRMAAPVRPERDPDGLDIPPTVAFDVAGAVQCPRCGAWYGVPADWTGFRCRACREPWRWASCGQCRRGALVEGGAEDWQCETCAHITPAWWRSGNPLQHERGVLSARRRTVEERTEPADTPSVARVRPSRAALVAVLVLVGLVAVVVGSVAFGGGSSARSDDEEVCGEYALLATDLGSSEQSASDVVARTERISRLGEHASPAIAAAATGLANAVPPGTSEFLAAEQRFTDACAAR